MNDRRINPNILIIIGAILLLLGMIAPVYALANGMSVSALSQLAGLASLFGSYMSFDQQLLIFFAKFYLPFLLLGAACVVFGFVLKSQANGGSASFHTPSGGSTPPVHQEVPGPAHGGSSHRVILGHSSGPAWPISLVGSVNGQPIRYSKTIRGTVNIGRDRHCNCIIGESSVSHFHLRLTAKPDGVYAENLSSTNPARLNGTPMTHSKRLNNGDHLTLGHVELNMRYM